MKNTNKTLPAANPVSDSSSKKAAAGQNDHAGRIASRAYEIWEAEGQGHGNDQDHWLRAEREVGASPESQRVDREPLANVGEGNETDPARRQGGTTSTGMPADTKNGALSG